jgi:hypothetical protein
MAAAAANGLQASQAMAATEFSRQASLYGPRRSGIVGFQSVWGLRPTSMPWGVTTTWLNR